MTEDVRLPMATDERGGLLKGEEDPKAAGSSFMVGATNLGASMLGMTIISMPLATAYGGYVLGPIVIVGMGLLADLSLCVLVRAAQLTQEKTFAGLGRRCMGPAGDAMVLTALLSILLGCAVTSVLIVAQLASHTLLTAFALEPDAAILQTEVMHAVVLLCAFPLMLLPNLSVLAPISSAALAGLLYVVVVVVAQWGRGGLAVDVEPARVSANLYSVLSITAGAYSCHFNMLPVYSELRPSERPRAYTLIHVVVAGAAVIYMLFGLAGYMQLGQETFACSNVLLCFSNPFIRAGATAVGMALFLRFPLLILPFRDALNGALFSVPLPFPMVALETSILCVVLYGLASTLSDVGQALALLGATAGTAIMFVLPGLFYARAVRRFAPEDLWGQIVGYALALVGVAVMVLGVYDVVRP